MKTTPITKFLGINNRLQDFELATEAGHYLAGADNVDIDDSGRIRRRSGTLRHQAMTDAHSLYMTSETTGFLVRASVLYAITLPSYTETLVKLLASNATMTYAILGDSVYWSNGTDIGRVTVGTAYPIGLPTPDAPALAAIGGSLLQGWFQVGISYSNATTGEEGGISPLASYQLTGTGGLRVTLPGATTGATHVNVYLSGSNGSVPQLAATLAASTATHDLIALATGRERSVRDEAPLPAGSVFVHNGCVCSFADSTLYVGLPFRPGYYLPAEGYVPFPATISVAVPNQGGVYVAADKTYFIPGDLGNVQETIRDVLPYGAVPGTAFATPDKTLVGWFGALGFVLADTSGAVTTPMSDTIKLTPPASGCATVLQCSGYRVVVACGWAMNLSSKAATTYSGWDFTSMSEHYGTKDDGIYLIQNIGTATATVNLGKLNFGSESMKFMPYVYLGVDSTGFMNLRVQAPGSVDYTYTSTRSGTDMRVHRIKAGKGLRANWFGLTITNTAGADFTLASVSFTPADTSRRI